MGLNIQKAIIFATLKHEGQKRKGTEIPYIVHPMEVMQILTELQCSEKVIIAGILHDTLEDTDATPEEIEKLFGSDVLALVQTESEDKSKTWKERKQTTIDHLQTASNETKIVCFADKLSNIRSIKRDFDAIGSKLWERFNAPKENLAWYYTSFIPIFEKIPAAGLCGLEAGRKFFDEYKTLAESVFKNT